MGRYTYGLVVVARGASILPAHSQERLSLTFMA